MATDHNIRQLVINKMTDEQYDQAVKSADELYLTPDSGSGGSSLPDQTGQAGKFLTTDGSTASWDNVPAGTVTSVRVQAGTGLSSSQSTAQTSTLNTTISIASGYKLPTTTEWSGKQDTISDLATIRSGAEAGATAVQPGDLATVATSGSYNDLSNKPTIPAAQVNSDWNASSGVAQILNKPTIPTVGNAEIEIQKNGTKVDSFTTNQSGNKKTINITVPTNNNELTNGAGYITSSDIPTNVSAFTNDAGYLTSHQNIKTLKTNNTTGQTASDSESIAGSGTINLHKVSKTGSYNDLLNKPTIPTVNNATLTIQKNGTTVNTFTANASTNVTANITVPTKTSDITNDSGYITSADIPTKLSDFTDDLGSSPVHTHSQYLTSHQTIKTLKTDNTTGQTTSSGEALTGSGTINLHKVAKTGSYNDLLNKPTIPTITDTYSATSSDGMSGKAVASAISNKADKATSLSGYGITDAYTKTEIDGMVSAGMHFKGTVASYSNLPATGNKVGDMWNVTDTGANYAWDGTAWDKLSENVDLSGYVPTSRTINGKALTGNITLSASDVGALPDSTTIPQGTVKSVRVQAGTGLSSSTSTAQTETLNTTISIASGYKLPTTTEWGNKQDALATQTAYTSKGSATKVPQITTNSLGQVTGITEVTITHPTEIPSQSGNSGKFLTTNGSAVSWATVDALPSQSGQSGKFLTTNGTTASWQAPVTWTYNAATKTMEVD